MTLPGLEMVQAEISALQPVRFAGRVAGIGNGIVSVEGLSQAAALGDLVAFRADAGAARWGEILKLESGSASVMPDGTTERLQLGDRVILTGEPRISPSDCWLGRVIDPYGRPIDGKPMLGGQVSRALRGRPTSPTARRGLGRRLGTGLAVFNTFLPIVRGQRIGLFAGSGVGKSTLLAKLALGLKADIVVLAMIGERGREVREFVEQVLGPEGMKRTVVVAATSDQSPLLRRRCALAAMTVAEHFRDTGHQVLFLADSVTRFAEAHREVALAAGEPSSYRGFPPSTAHMITTLCERAGPGAGTEGDITAIFTVLVAGSDMEEPVADIMRGVLDGHVVLDRKIAERGRFPAIDLLRSVSRALPGAADEAENELIRLGRQRLAAYERAEMMIQAGLYSAGSDPEVDAAIAVWPRLDKFLAESEWDSISASFTRLAACLRSDQPSDGV